MSVITSRRKKASRSRGAKKVALSAAGLAAQGQALKVQAASLSTQANELRAGAKDLGARAVPAATVVAAQAKDWAGPRITDARDGLGRARDRGVEVAAPRVEQAATALAPKVDAARDRIVDDVLPRFVEAVSAAAAAGAAKAASATEAAATTSSASLATTRKAARRAQTTEPSKTRRRLGRFLFFTGLLSAAGAAGYTVWKGRQQASDPWVPATASRQPATGAPSRLSTPGSGDAVGSGTLAAQSKDVATPAPDGVTAPADTTAPKTPPASGSSSPTTPAATTKTTPIATSGSGTPSTPSTPSAAPTTGTAGSTGTTGGAADRPAPSSSKNRTPRPPGQSGGTSR